MANEFVARKGLIVSGNAVISGSVTASSGFFGTASYATSASAATSITFNPISSSYAGTDWNAINNKPTVFSSSVQINTGSYTGSFTGSLLGSASYALSSSYALSARSASYAGTDWNAINNRPIGIFSSSAQLPTGVVSSSAQINTGSFTGSFTGAFQGLGSGITGVISSSYALSASWSPGSVGGDFNTLVNKPTLVSSSAQINTGSFTGSFTGSLLGSVLSASYAATASAADDFFVSGSLISRGGDNADTTNTAVGMGALKSQYVGPVKNSQNTAIGRDASLYVVSGTQNTVVGYTAGRGLINSVQPTLNNQITVVGSNALSNIIQTPAVTAIGANALLTHYSGGFNTVIGADTSRLSKSGSYNTSVGVSSLYSNESGSRNVVIGAYAGYYETGSNTFYIDSYDRNALKAQQTGSLMYGRFADNPANQMLTINANISMSQNVLAMQGITGSLQGSSSYALSASWAPTSAGSDWNTLVNKPVGIVSSSAQINTGSFTGSFTGSLLGSASYATMALTASYMTGSINFSNGLTVTGSVTASAYTGSFTGSLLGSASYALSASWAPGAGGDWSTITNKPIGLVSSSAQVNTGSFTGSFTGSLLGSASYALSSSYALAACSASYANTDWNAINNKPTVVSSSAQINTGSFTGSFTGAFQGIGSGITGVISSSYALTASWAPSLPSVSASYALTSSYASLAENVLGSITSASYALNATSASYVTGGIEFPNGLIVTGSVTASAYTGSFTGSLFGSASYALSASWAPGGGGDWATITNKPVGLVSSSAQVNTGSFTGSFTGDISASRWDYVRSTATYQILSAAPAGNYTASVTLSLGQILIMTGSGAIGNTYWRVYDGDFTSTDGFILMYASGGIRGNTWPMKNDVPLTANSASWPGGITPMLTPSGGVDTIVFTTTPWGGWGGVVSKRDSR